MNKLTLNEPAITTLKLSCGKVMFLHLSVIQFTGGVSARGGGAGMSACRGRGVGGRGGVCILACVTGHMTNQRYINSCIGVDSQLVLGQHTGNI